MGEEGELAALREEVASLRRTVSDILDALHILGFDVPVPSPSASQVDGEVHIVSYGGITCTYEGDADPAEVLAAGRRILAEERGELPFGEPPSGAG